MQGKCWVRPRPSHSKARRDDGKAKSKQGNVRQDKARLTNAKAMPDQGKPR